MTSPKVWHTGASLENVNLRGVSDFVLDGTFIRGTQFTPVASRWWAFACNRAFPWLRHHFERWGWGWGARRAGYAPIYNDPWSVLRQHYAGPRALFLFFYVVLFALPYVGRAAFYSATSHAEQRVIDAWQAQKAHWREPHHAVAGPVAQAIPTPFDGPERWVRRHTQPRTVFEVLVKWDGPTVRSFVNSGLAALLILYNAGVYWLVTGVGSLRDEEERSHWSPAWKDYGYLRWVHWAVSALFYVSLVSFLVNTGELAAEVVYVPDR